MSRATCPVWPARRWKRAIAPRLSRAAVFAGRFAGRYCRVSAAVRRLELLPASRSRHAITLVHRYGNRNSVSHTLLNRILVRVDAYGKSKETANLPRSRDAAPIRSGKEHAGAPTMPSARAPRRQPLGEALVPRLMVRSRRLESVTFAGPAKPARRLRPSATTLARSEPDARGSDPADLPVLRQRASIVAGNGATQGEPVVDPSRREARFSPRAATAPAMPSLAELEVERIAERVIGSLDRRIVAQRERMGRI